MFNLLKPKIKFRSDLPPIKSIKPILIEAEEWFNHLINKEGFSVSKEYPRNGSRKYRHVDDKLNYKNIRSIDAGWITKQALSAGRQRFDYSINLFVSWGAEFCYEKFYYGFEPVKKELFLLNLPELPPPMFSYSFSFWEWLPRTKENLNDHNEQKTINIIDEDIFPPVPPSDPFREYSIHYINWRPKGKKNLDNVVRDLKIMKTEYFNFIQKVNLHLSKFNANIDQIHKHNSMNKEFRQKFDLR